MIIYIFSIFFWFCDTFCLLCLSNAPWLTAACFFFFFFKYKRQLVSPQVLSVSYLLAEVLWLLGFELHATIISAVVRSLHLSVDPTRIKQGFITWSLRFSLLVSRQALPVHIKGRKHSAATITHDSPCWRSQIGLLECGSFLTSCFIKQRSRVSSVWYLGWENPRQKPLQSNHAVQWSS